jgi:hypothetical protein
MGVKLIYKDVALGADEDAAVTATEAESFSDIDKIPFGVEAPAIATAELNGWGLTHDYQVYDDNRVAFWSKERSGADCSFDSPPTITLTFDQQYTSTGLTVRFSPATMDYCTEIGVTWYQGGVVKRRGTYYPDAPNYVIAEMVEAYDKLVFTFAKTNLPGKRLKIEKLTIGVIREFGGDELTGANFLHEISPISDTVPVNVLDATFHSKDDVEFVFQRKQPVEGYNGDELIGVYYIETGKRTGARDYTIACSDIIGVWEIEEYSGGIWINDTALTTILTSVFGDLKYFDIAPAFSTSKLRGYIEPGTKRTALQQIAFALGAVVDTSGTDKVKLYPAPTGTGTTIPAEKTYIGGSVDVADKVTEVTVTAYVIFDERPSDNQEYIEFNGVKYRYYTDTKHAYNPDVISTDLPNKVKFTNSYLVNLSNAQSIADKIMAYYMRREKYAFKHVLSGQKPGDRATVSLPWGGATSGNITKMSISVTGITVSDTEMLLD